MLTVIWPFGSNFDPIVFLQQLVMKLLTRNQVLRPTLSFHASHCWALPRADVAPTQHQGRSGTHCVASAHKGSMLEVEMGGVWGGEAFLRPFLHWQCQLGTVPYTVPYFTVITVKYGVTITVVRHNLTSTVRTVQTVFVPYRTTRQA